MVVVHPTVHDIHNHHSIIITVIIIVLDIISIINTILIVVVNTIIINSIVIINTIIVINTTPPPTSSSLCQRPSDLNHQVIVDQPFINGFFKLFPSFQFPTFSCSVYPTYLSISEISVITNNNNKNEWTKAIAN